MSIRVYLIAGKHPHYHGQVCFPPRDVQYIPWFAGPSKSDFDSLNVYSPSLDFIRHSTNKIFGVLKIPSIFYSVKHSDIIHSNSLLILNNRPWIVEAEHAASFLGLQTSRLYNKSYTKKVEKMLSKKNCKYILPMTEMSKKTIEYFYDTSNFHKKIQVLYPSIASMPKFQKKPTDYFTLLYVSNTFFDKGGKEVVEAFYELEKKYDLKLHIKSTVKHNHPHYNNFVKFKQKHEKNQNILFDQTHYSRDDLFSKVYNKSDIFVYPTFGDMFGGFVLLEAMASGLPCIGPKLGSVPEVISDNQTGLLFNTPIPEFETSYNLNYQHDYSQKHFPEIINQIIEKVSILIENDSIRDRMRKNALEEISEGKFSVKFRNKKLKEIYEDCLS